MRAADIEDAILSSFLFAPMMDDTKEVFTLNQDYFTTEFRKRVAKNINDAVSNGTLGVLDTFLEDKVSGTRFEIAYLDILAQTPIPLSLAKKYHDEFLRKKYHSKLTQGLL